MEMSHSQYTAKQNAALALVSEMAGVDLTEPWPEPEPLIGDLPPVEKMTSEMLPRSLRPMIEDIAYLMQVPLDFPAVAAVATLAGMVNRRALIQPKARDSSWTVVPNLWGCIVAEPGSMKSAILSALTGPAKELEAAWRRDHESAQSDYEQKVTTHELAMDAWRDAVRAAIKAGAEAPKSPEEAPAAPAQRRLITSDATAAKLHDMLSQNPTGLFVVRDELAGLLANLSNESNSQERSLYLEAWNGDQPYMMDRVGRGSICVKHTCLSVFGGIQPSRLRQYLEDAMHGSAHDGLMQRFQLIAWPDITKAAWSYRDAEPNMAARNQAAAIYRRLAGMNSEAPVAFRFTAEAQELFVEWLTELENRLRAPHISEVMRAHLAKYRSLMPSLSLLFALADGEQTHAALHHAQLAARWCVYLESHAERVYSAHASPEQSTTMTLGRRIIDGQLGQRFKARDVQRKCWSGLSTPAEVQQALNTLEELNWLRRSKTPAKTTGRPPADTYHVNPLLEASHAES